MSDERGNVVKRDDDELGKVLATDDEPDVEAHKVLHANEDPDDQPDVEAHKLTAKVQAKHEF
jgi:hypothetical protein